MNKIAIIIPYFGKFPIWFNLYLYSCSRNSFIDFIFYTDCEIPEKKYNNTIFHTISFEKYCENVSNILNITFTPQGPYKLCDLKCFYGLVHEKDLSQYEFWGFGDIDLVYGDLTILVNDENLSKYDLISTHADRVAGHFTIIRNINKYRTLCTHIPNWKDLLENEDIYGLDENYFTKLIYPSINTLVRIYRVLKRLLKLNICLYGFLEIPNRIRNVFSKFYIKEHYTSELPRTGQKWHYDLKTGKIINWRNKEIPYLHFLFFKKTQFWKTDTYWKPGYWQVPNMDFDKVKGKIVFDNQKVEYKK